MSYLQGRIADDDFARRMIGSEAATADRSAPLADESMSDVLRILREVLAMDVEFVPRLEMGQRVPDGRSVGSLLSTPILLADGSLHGFLCCLGSAADRALTAECALKRLRMAARFAAKLVDQAKARERGA